MVSIKKKLVAARIDEDLIKECEKLINDKGNREYTLSMLIRDSLRSFVKSEKERSKLLKKIKSVT